MGKDKKNHSIEDIITYHNEKMSSKLCAKTLCHYRTSQKYIRQYIKEEFKSSDIYLKDLNYAFVIGFESFLRSYQPRHYQGKIGNNAVMKHIQRLRKMVTLSYNIEWLDHDPFIKFKSKLIKREREFLSKQELNTLAEREIKWERLAIVRDMFVFCCYTGLAYVDIQKLTPDNIVRDIDGNLSILAKRTKTKTKLVIPLLPPAFAILNKYKGNPKVINGDCVLPVLSNQKSNAYLKEIALLCGIKKNLTTHLARHTFATTVTLTNGVPLETVGNMLGHKNLRTTQHYAKIIDRKVNEDMRMLSEKLAKEEHESNPMIKHKKNHTLNQDYIY
ncbi:site-specific integrase [Aequorivita sp. SDUM287046]|uniref:Site-specific integrase n=1 Tax=Aequorivita aurantiaca TaxID=3053356 RepID=A0ABT8DIW7_9FLAO|nr:site-specific integrase [Aequorivita aurantiaca]MDN3725321.1 site-specific integrase [Aequorivita aurantiaca]